jgi:hypothetical protein
LLIKPTGFLMRFRPRPLLFALGAGCAEFVLNQLEMPVSGGTALIFGGALSLLTAFTLEPDHGRLAFVVGWPRMRAPLSLGCLVAQSCSRDAWLGIRPNPARSFPSL